jgi:hypothetical protein
MLGLPVIALMLVAPGEMKCPATVASMPGYGTREAVFMIDGIISQNPADTGMDLQEDIAWHELTCWDHQTDSFERSGIQIVRIQTKALVAATRAPLLQLIQAQEAFRARHERYAPDLASLQPFGLDPEVRLDFETSESGWKASTPPGPIAHSCSATEASIATLREDGEPELDCTQVDTLALRSLRTLFDSGG